MLKLRYGLIAIMKSKRVMIITSLFLFLFSFSIQTIVGLLYNQLFVSDISFLFHKVFAQKSVFITPDASNSNNNNNDAFVPPVDVVSSGSIVSWTNEDSTIHTVTADDIKRSESESNEVPLFDSGPISPDGRFDNAFDSTGVFGYHCSIHPFMRGSVIVN
jgi:plastocyanin